MTLILGADPSKCTGWALLDTTRDLSAIQCGCLEMPAKSDHYFTSDQIGLKTTTLLRQCKQDFGRYPDFAVLEQQIEAQASMAGRGQSFAGSIYPWIATSAIVATLANFKVPYGTIMPASWRKMFFSGYVIPEKPVMETVVENGVKVRRQVVGKDGKPKFQKDWKTAAIRKCEELGINLPSNKELADDAAEACAIAICWPSRDMNLHAGRYREPWMALLQQRNERGVAA